MRRVDVPKSEQKASLPLLFDGAESEIAAEKRLQLFSQCWTACEQEIARITQSADEQVLARVLRSISASYTASTLASANAQFHDALDVCIVSQGGVGNGIPRAEGASRLAGLCRLIKRERPNWLCALATRSSDSAQLSALKPLLKRLLSQLVPADCPEWMSRYAVHDVEAFARYYNSVLRSANSTDLPKVVLILPDVELLDKTVLHDLVAILYSLHVDRGIPVVLVLGCATGADRVVGDLLHGRTIELIRYERFTLHNPEQCLEEIVERLFVGNLSTVKLGGEQLQDLLDRFQSIDHSLATFMAATKVCARAGCDVN